MAEVGSFSSDVTVQPDFARTGRATALVSGLLRRVEPWERPARRPWLVPNRPSAVSSKTAGMSSCHHCSGALPPDARFCVHCGQAAVPSCPRCHNQANQGDLFCVACGQDLRASVQVEPAIETEPEPAPVPEPAPEPERPVASPAGGSRLAALGGLLALAGIGLLGYAYRPGEPPSPSASISVPSTSPTPPTVEVTPEPPPILETATPTPTPTPTPVREPILYQAEGDLNGDGQPEKATVVSLDGKASKALRVYSQDGSLQFQSQSFAEPFDTSLDKLAENAGQKAGLHILAGQPYPRIRLIFASCSGNLADFQFDGRTYVLATSGGVRE